ncbi:hypothetical protein PFISCL1PPCAC_26814, partial [Pristionchus fissidentatus]
NFTEVLAGCLNPPHYFSNYPKSINYGSLGVVIGHEITHGFDPKGSQHDHEGKKKNWWDNSTREEFNQRVKCISDQINSGTDPIDGINLSLQVGENVADLGGLKAAYQAYQMYLQQNGPERPLPNFPEITNDQLFFLGYGQ